MADGLIRLAVVVIVAAAAILIGLLWRRGTAWVRRHKSFAGLTDGVYLFTSAPCESCTPAREALVASGVPFREVSYESEPELFDVLGVEKVPALVRVSGGQGWIAFGRPRRAAIRRWLGDA